MLMWTLVAILSRNRFINSSDAVKDMYKYQLFITRSPANGVRCLCSVEG